MVKPTKPRYMLIDGNAWIHRGFHAIPILNTKSGEQTNAVYGFTSILLKAIADIKPTHIACTFDLAGPTFRHEKYKEYKATRVKADQALYDQIPRVKEVVWALNIPIFEKQGFEADDCLGTLAVHIHKNNPEAEVLIATGDLDTLQLVNHVIKVYTLRKGITDTAVYDAKAVRARYGLNPDQMVDYRALKGDPSDNIPGVKGIGEKGAIELIKQFGSISEMYKVLHKEIKEAGLKIPNDKYQIPNKFQISKIKPRILNLLVEQEEQARMSYEISQIVLDVPLDIKIPKYQLDPAHSQATVKLFQELEFRSLVGKLPKTDQVVVSPFMGSIRAADESANYKATGIEKQVYQLVDTTEKLEHALKILSKASEISVDTETTGLNQIEAELVGVGFSAKPGEVFYVPARLALDSADLKKIIASSHINKIGHNLKYDLQILTASGLPLNAIFFDTMVASYLLNAGTRQHNLDTLAFNELGYQMQPIEELIGKGKNQITMDKVPAEKVSWYCCEDVDMTLRLKDIFEPKLREEKLEKIFYEIEMPLVSVLADMERAGIKLDVKLLNRMAGEVEVDIRQLEQDIHKLTGEPELNINSPIQLREVLFEKLKLLPPDGKGKKTKTGLSTAAAELEKLRGQHPVVEKLLQYRELSKLYSTYLLTLPILVSKKTGRIHTSYNQTIAATGRLSSTDPNLQNIPIRGTGMGNRIRQGFVAEKGYQLLSLDYSQIELRIVAHLAQEKRMMEIFRKGEDIHTNTAKEIFGVPEDEVTPDMRRDAKTINFGILYGLSSFGLSSRIGEVSRAEARDFIDKYFKAYPNVAKYIEGIREEVNKTGIVYNQLGRFRRFPEIHTRNWQVRAGAERAAINFPIQSLAADVIKVAMINIQKEIRNPKSEIRMLLQVHDELVFEVKQDKVEHYAKMLQPIMEQAIKLSVPINAEAKAGDNWGEMKKLEL